MEVRRHFAQIADLDLHELGPCLVGANPQAGLVEVKDALHDAVERGEIARPSDAELRAQLDALTGKSSHVNRKPRRVATFEVE